jgi:hypothetical protein
MPEIILIFSFTIIGLLGVAFFYYIGFCILSDAWRINFLYPIFEPIKNIFSYCEHEYVFFDKEYKDWGGDFSWDVMAFHFICKKCQKEKILYDYKIIDTFKKYKELEKRNKALQINRNIDISSINIPRYGEYKNFSGKYVTQVIDYYKKLGFDLTEINNK